MLHQNGNIKDLISYYKQEQNTPLKFITEHHGELKSELAIPSKAHTYSMCIEYVKEWFESAFQPGFFKSSYIDGKNVIADFRGLSREELLKRNRPCYMMKPTIDMDYNREMRDHYAFGANIFNNNCGVESSFYQNYKSNTFIALDSKIALIRFAFRIKLNTLASAQDIVEFMRIKFRAGGTMGREVDLDFHIPTSLMLQVAHDNGFQIHNGEIVDIVGFLCHMNMNSRMPIIYKRRHSTGQKQFFVKVPDTYIHFRVSDIRMDEGERQGHIMTNFNVDFDMEVRFPAPKFYAYHSFETTKYITREMEEDGVITLEDFPILSVPKVNSKGWNQFISTDYLDDKDNFVNKNVLTVEFNELLGDIRKVIDYTKAMYLSPGLFIDIKLFNSNDEQSIIIDWDKYTITTKEPMLDRRSYIVFYVDTNYLNDNILKLKDETTERITPFIKSKTVRG